MAYTPEGELSPGLPIKTEHDGMMATGSWGGSAGYTRGAGGMGGHSGIPSSRSFLPPCSVCGEKSSGFHYGANTCQACKGFFRRCLVRKSEYVCTNKRKCDVTPNSRNSCPGCRYQRCLAAGMSKHAIKTGRYTHEKKTRDTEEVTRLSLQSKIGEDGTMVAKGEQRARKLEKIIEEITLLHRQQVPCDNSVMKEICNKEKRVVETMQLEAEMFGQQRPLSREDFKAIYNSTGVDLDGTRDTLGKMLKGMEFMIQRMIRFSKSLPGFLKMPIEDQVELVKASLLEWYVMMYSGWQNIEHKLVSMQPVGVDLFVKLNDLERFSDRREDVQVLWKIIMKVQSLELTGEEQALTVALCVMNGGTEADLSRPGQIIASASSDYLLEALEYLVHKNHDPEDLVLAKIITIITDLRSLKKFHDAAQRNMINDAISVKDLNIPELYLELFIPLLSRHSVTEMTL